MRFPLALLLPWAPALAMAAPPAYIVGSSQCPTPAALAAALARALPGRAVRTGPPAGGESALVEIADRGPRFQVRAAGAARNFPDERRDCAERARVGAVFVALVLEPPWLAPEPAPPPAGPRLPPRAPVLQRARELFVAIEAGGALEGAPRLGRGEENPLTGGAKLRVTVGTPRLAGSVGAAALAPVDLVQLGATARLWRVPFDLSARAALRRGRIELGADAGLAAAVLSLRGLTVPEPVEAIRLEWSPRVAAILRLWVHPRLAPFLALEGQLALGPYQLVLEPAAVVGETPR